MGNCDVFTSEVIDVAVPVKVIDVIPIFSDKL